MAERSEADLGNAFDADDTLDPAELAALRDEEPPARAAPEADADAETEGDGDDLDLGEGEGEDDPDADEEDEGAGDDETPPPAADEDDPALPEPPPLPAPPPAFTDEDKAKQTELEAERTTLFEQYDNADLTREEFQAKLTALDEDRLALKAKADAVAKHADDVKKAVETYNAAADEVWAQTQDKWLKAHPEVAGMPQEGQVAFDRLMRVYTGADMGQGKTITQQHDDVLKMFKERYPKALAEKPDNRHPADKKRAENPPQRVPALSNMPAAEQSDATDGEFAWLDQLATSKRPGAMEKYEEAFAKLTPEQEARYMQSSRRR